MNATSAPSWTCRSWLAGLLLVAAIVFAYQPAWRAGFIWDDNDYVTDNPLLTAPDGLRRIWFSTDSPSQYFPLVYTTFRIERSLWGLNASGFHWVNILLHAANAVLVWRLLRRLAVPGALLAAAIFALHPVNVESVAWVTELKNVQSLFFFLLALLAWTAFVMRSAETVFPKENEKDYENENELRPCRRGALTPREADVAGTRGGGLPPTVLTTAASPLSLSPSLRNAALFYGLALLCHALALFSKTTACTLPAALLLILWLMRKPLTRARWLQVLPFVALSLAMGAVSIWWERNHQGTEGTFYALSWLDRVLVASRAFWFYIGKLLWPANLTFSYPLWRIDAGTLSAYGWLAVTAGLVVAIWSLRRFTGRSVEVAALFFAAMLFPMIGFFMMYTFKYTFVADHYQYVAMIGPVALMAAGIDRLLCARIKTVRLAGVGVCVGLLALLSALTWRQSRMYRDLETLWSTTIARNPDSYMGHNNLGAIFLARGDADRALVHFEKALAIFPDHANAHGNLAHALLQKGRVDDALAHFRKAAAIDPQAPKSHSDLAFGLIQAGQIDEAIAQAAQAVKTLPNAAEAHHVLGLALLSGGKPEDAIAHFRAALQLRPDYVEARRNLGNALVQVGQTEDAIVELQRTLAIEPDALDARYNLAIALFKLGRIAEAIPHFQKVADAQPGNAEAQNNLGWAMLQVGRADEAIARFQNVLRLQPEFAIAHCNLAIALVRKGDAREALAQYRTFLQSNPDVAPVLSEVAWLLATWPETSIRDATKAVELALRADELSHHQDATILRTLAAAYAEAGRFADAVATAKQACEIAEAQANVVLRDALKSQLAIYESGAPFRDPPVAAGLQSTPSAPQHN